MSEMQRILDESRVTLTMGAQTKEEKDDWWGRSVSNLFL